ncbi:MAG: hypothetical protein RBU27_05440 [Bacteroidota bacterium]|jgi:hypothetical protein|nr:hypothetical protein [Bacteroidota bacterium]
MKTDADVLREVDTRGSSTVQPLDLLYSAYGDNAPKIMDAFSKLAQMRIGGGMSAVDMRKPFYVRGRPGSHRTGGVTLGANDRATGEIYLSTDELAKHPGLSKERDKTVEHELIHSLLPWVQRNWPDNPLDKFIAANSRQVSKPGVPAFIDGVSPVEKIIQPSGEYLYDISAAKGAVARTMPTALNVVTGKPQSYPVLSPGYTTTGRRSSVGGLEYDNHDFMSRQGGLENLDSKPYSRSDADYYQHSADEAQANSIQGARSVGYHPIIEAINAGMFDNFDPATFDRKWIESLFNTGIEKLHRTYQQNNQDPGDHYDMLINTYRGKQKDSPRIKIDRGDPRVKKGEQLLRGLPRGIYMNYAQAQQPDAASGGYA